MTRQQELSCPKCGARIYFTDVQCLSCGARLDDGQPADEPGREGAPPAARAETGRGLKTALRMGKMIVRGALIGFATYRSGWLARQAFISPHPTSLELRNWGIFVVALGAIGFFVGAFCWDMFVEEAGQWRRIRPPFSITHRRRR